MYNITLTYIKLNSTSPILIEYTVTANSYGEAVGLIQAKANRRVEVMGGTVVSIV